LKPKPSKVEEKQQEMKIKNFVFAKPKVKSNNLSPLAAPAKNKKQKDLNARIQKFVSVSSAVVVWFFLSFSFHACGWRNAP